MKHQNVVFILVLAVIFIQFVVIGFLLKKIWDVQTITDYISYDKNRKLYSVNNEEQEYKIWVALNDNGNMYYCAVDARDGVKASIIINGNISTLTFRNHEFQSFQYFNLTDDILLDREEHIGSFSRHSQVHKDGSMQQRKWNYVKKEWEMELPTNGVWRDFSD